MIDDRMLEEMYSLYRELLARVTSRCWVPDCRLALNHLGKHDPKAEQPVDPRRVYSELLVEVLRLDRDRREVKRKSKEAYDTMQTYDATEKTLAALAAKAGKFFERLTGMAESAVVERTRQATDALRSPYWFKYRNS